MDQLYVDRANGQWECFTYSENEKYLITIKHSRQAVETFAHYYGYQLIWVTTY
jgi:hypothetical protein